MALLWSDVAAAAVFTVNIKADAKDRSTADGVCDASSTTGLQCSLRAAIQQANAQSSADIIQFHIAGTGVQRVKPNTALPTITHPVTINGYSQPGAAPNTAPVGTNAKIRIDLDGSNIGVSGAQGLVIAGGNSVVRGLAINNFPESVPCCSSEGFGLKLAGAPGNVDNIIRGNFIGTDPAGTADEPDESGILTAGVSTGNQIGGTTPASRNLISGNNNGGINLSSPSNFVTGNLVGTDKTGIKEVGNLSAGIVIGADNNRVTLNTIAWNGFNGVAVSSGTGNLIGPNSIFFNEGQGIDLGNDGRTPNDVGSPPDTDTGPNELQNFPDILEPTTTATGDTTVDLFLHSTPNSAFVIRFFRSPPGTSQGKTFVEADTVHTDNNGLFFALPFHLRHTVPIDQTLTATATDMGRNTSEFSDPVLVRSP